MTEPRHFWRRGFALLVDLAVAFAVTLVVLLPFHDPDRTALRLSDYPVSFNQCQSVQSLPQPFHDLVAPENINAAQICRHWSMGIYNGRTATLVYGLQESESGMATARTFRTLSVPIDANGDIVGNLIEPQTPLMWLAIMLGSILLFARGCQSPGKALLALKITGTGCIVCREIRRIGPLFVLSILGGFGPALLQKAVLLPAWAIIGPGLLVLVFFLLYYILPMIRWRGAMPWDKATDFTVTRA